MKRALAAALPEGFHKRLPLLDGRADRLDALGHRIAPLEKDRDVAAMLWALRILNPLVQLCEISKIRRTAHAERELRTSDRRTGRTSA